MKIHTDGFLFTCECGIYAEANVASDFHCVNCNGTDNYFVVCPNCGEKHLVLEELLPKHVNPTAIKKQPCFSNNG